MKKRTSLVAAIVAATPWAALAADPAMAPPPGVEKRWLTTATLDFMYFSYRGTFGTTPPQAPFLVRGGGSQFYMPISVQTVGAPNDVLKLEFLARSGLVSSRQTTPGYTGSYAGPTDTLLSATATYMGMPGFQPFLGVTMNLPTGKPALFGDQGRARLDPDFVDVPSFGEGFNIGVTAGANVPITPNLIWNFSLGYTNRGAFTREGPFDFFGNQLTSRINPGDLFTASTSLSYSEGSFSGQVQASVSHDTTTAIDGLATFRSGHRFTLTGQGTYAFSEVLSATLSGMFAHGQANYIADPFNFGPGLVREAMNSNSNVYRVALEATYRATPYWSLGPTASWLFRDNNSYNPVDAQFIPAKSRFAIGAFSAYNITDTVTLNLRASHVWTNEAATPDKFDPLNGGIIFGSSFPRISYNGWQISGGVVGRF